MGEAKRKAAARARERDAKMEILRSAQPHLIFRAYVEIDQKVCSFAPPYIRETEPSHEVIDEGYDPDHSPLGVPVYWRIAERDDGRFYLSTFLASRAYVIKTWGMEGLAYCDPVTGLAAVRIETELPLPIATMEESQSGTQAH